MYYSSNGIDKPFYPAKKTIHNATGIDISDIKEVRNRLQKLSVIDYKCNQYEHYIFINWTVIRGYALLAITRERSGLTEPLEVGGNKRKYFVQESQIEYAKHPCTDKTQRANDIISNLYSDNYLDYLANLTEYEYKYLQCFVKKELR